MHQPAKWAAGGMLERLSLSCTLRENIPAGADETRTVQLGNLEP